MLWFAVELLLEVAGIVLDRTVWPSAHPRSAPTRPPGWPHWDLGCLAHRRLLESLRGVYGAVAIVDVWRF